MSNLVDLATLDKRLDRLERPASGGLVSGLSVALARRWGVDPLLVRIGFVGLAFSGGLGIIAYLWLTAITPREDLAAPVERHWPAFARWDTGTQVMVIGATSVLAVILLASSVGVAWGTTAAAILLLVLLHRRPGDDTLAPAALHSAPPAPSGVPSTGLPMESVAAWRAHLAPYTGTPDATSPALRDAVPTPAPRPSPSWWGALAVLALGAAGSLPAVALGWSPTPAWALVGSTLAMGLGLTLWGLVARRRIPAFVLVAALVSAGATAGTALLLQPDDVTTPVTDVAVHRFVAEDATLDLTALDSSVPATIDIEATASSLRVILPGAVEEITTSSALSDVTLPPGLQADRDDDPIPWTVHITARLSDVEVRTP